MSNLPQENRQVYLAQDTGRGSVSVKLDPIQIHCDIVTLGNGSPLHSQASGERHHRPTLYDPDA